MCVLAILLGGFWRSQHWSLQLQPFYPWRHLSRQAVGFEKLRDACEPLRYPLNHSPIPPPVHMFSSLSGVNLLQVAMSKWCLFSWVGSLSVLSPILGTQLSTVPFSYTLILSLESPLRFSNPVYFLFFNGCLSNPFDFFCIKIFSFYYFFHLFYILTSLPSFFSSGSLPPRPVSPSPIHSFSVQKRTGLRVSQQSMSYHVEAGPSSSPYCKVKWGILAWGMGSKKTDPAPIIRDSTNRPSDTIIIYTQRA